MKRYPLFLLHTVAVMFMAACLFPQFESGSGGLYRAYLPHVASIWCVVAMLIAMGIVILLLLRQRYKSAWIIALVATVYPAHFGVVMLWHAMAGLDFELLIYGFSLPFPYFLHATFLLVRRRAGLRA